MSKGKSTWKYNKLLTGRNNYYAFGDFMFNKDKDGNVTNRSFGNMSDLGKGVVSAAGQAVGQIGGGLIGGGLQSGAGNIMQGLSSVTSAIPGPFGTIASAGLGLVGGLTNRMFGSKMNEENIAKVQSNINELNSFQSNALDFDALSQNWANSPTGMTFSNSFIGKDGWFSNKAKKKANALRAQIGEGIDWVENSLNNNANNIFTTQLQNMLANYSAYGGPLYASGGSIHIKPENKGKFTETKRRTGKTTEELTHSKNPLTRKRAIFAQNAKKWHHAFGGELNTQGGNFTNGLLFIDNGGSHESNPYEGVQLGVDPEGTPNLVEEGETVFNDYVFSNRMNVPKAVRNKYKLRGNKPLTFADASKILAKESEERPNDPISMRGLQAMMADLASSQESIRMRKEMKSLSNRFDDGGFTFTNPEADNNKNKLLPTKMRYLPAFASGVMSITDALGLTNKPDYSDANAILEAGRNASNYTPIKFRPVGNYLTYRPFDVDRAINKMNAQAGATRRNLLNTSGGNRSTAMAGLLAADNNYLNSIGDLAIKADEANLAQKQKVEEFNRGTNTFNSTGFKEVDKANLEAQLNSRSTYLKGALTAAEVRQRERQAATASRSANLSNFINSLGDIGRENFIFNLINDNPALYYALTNSGGSEYKGITRSNGGLLTVKKRKRRK